MAVQRIAPPKRAVKGKSATKPGLKRPGPSLEKVALSELSLPTELSVPSENLLDYTWLIYGERKIGKTSLLSRFSAEKTFFMMFEPGAKALALRKRDVLAWAEFEQYVKMLEANPGYSELNIIDTGGACFDMCLAQVKKDFDLEDIRDKAWGGGYTEVAQRLQSLHDRLTRIGGFAVTAHSEIKRIEPKFGPAYDKLSIQLSKGAFKYYTGVVDTIAYYHYNDHGQRVLTIRGDEGVEAGTRCEGHFLYPDGTQIKDIPMGNSPDEGFRNLRLAFDNKLPKAVKKAAVKRA